MGWEEDLDWAQGGQNTFLLSATLSLSFLGFSLTCFFFFHSFFYLSAQSLNTMFSELSGPRDAGLGREAAVEAESAPAAFSLV
jgi:hypothetical protein